MSPESYSKLAIHEKHKTRNKGTHSDISQSKTIIDANFVDKVSRACVPREDTPTEPVEIYNQIQKEIKCYKMYCKRLKKVQKKQKLYTLLLNEAELRRELKGYNNKRFKMKLASLKCQIHKLQTIRNNFASEQVEARAVFKVNEKEKEALKKILIKKWKNDLCEVLFEENMGQYASNGRIFESSLSAWEYLFIKQLSFEEIKELLVILVKSKQNSITEYFKRKSMQKGKVYCEKPSFHVDIEEFLSPPKVEYKGKQSSQEKETINMLTLLQKAKMEIDDDQTKTYEEFLDLMDSELTQYYKIYQNQTGVYTDLAPSVETHMKEEKKSKRHLSEYL